MLGIISCSCSRGFRLKSVKPRLGCLQPWLRLTEGHHLVSPHFSRVVSTGVSAHSTAQDSKEVSGKEMLGILAGYVWPKDNVEVKTRVVGALGLLVGAKVFYGIWFALTYNIFCKGCQHMCAVYLLPRSGLFEHSEPVELVHAGVGGCYYDHDHAHWIWCCQNWSPWLQ